MRLRWWRRSEPRPDRRAAAAHARAEAKLRAARELETDVRQAVDGFAAAIAAAMARRAR